MEFCTYPPCHYFYPQIKFDVKSPTYLPLVTMMSHFFLFFKSSLKRNENHFAESLNHSFARPNKKIEFNIPLLFFFLPVLRDQTL